MTYHATTSTSSPRLRRGFTLTELLIVFMIIALLAGMALSALSGASEMARANRTRSIITKIDSHIMEKWDSYRTRPVPIRPAAGTPPIIVARARLYALRELQRMELPDRKSDLVDGTVQRATATGIATSSAMNGFFRRARAASGNDLTKWSTTHEGSECLYLILASIRDGDTSALDAFTPDEIGDTDGDGLREVLDGWGNPIAFIRWPAGYTIQNSVVTTQSANSVAAPDPFDPVRSDPRWTDGTAGNDPYAVAPLIFSAGPDKEYEINTGGGVIYTQPIPPNPANDPYYPTTPLVGTPIGTTGWQDNITNHYVEAP